MASPRWKGAALDVVEVQTVTVTGNDVTSTYKLKVGGKYVTTIGLASATLTAAALVTAWNASTEPELAEITATSALGVVTLTQDTAGVPFTVTSSVSGGAGTIGAASVTSAATGKHFWDNADNWSTGAVPVAADTVWLEQSDVDIKYGLAQSAVTLTALHILSSFTGNVGLPELNQDGSSSYLEYRATYLAISATTANVGDGPGQGSSLIKLNVGTVQCALNVRNTASGSGANLEAIQWKGTHASNVVNITKGSLAIAGYGGDAATVATLTVGFVSSPDSDATVRGGTGLSLTTLNMTGGNVELNAGLTTVSKVAGTLLLKAGSLTTLTDDGGKTTYTGTGTITTANVNGGATLDCSPDMRARTITTLKMYAGATFLDPFGTVTVTNPVQLIRCKVGQVSIDVGFNRSLAIS